MDKCILVQLDIQFADGKTLEKWECELLDRDAANAGKRFVEIEGLDDSDFDGISSGVTTLFAEGSVLSNGKLLIPKGQKITIGTIEPRGPAARKKMEKQKNRGGTQQQRRLAPLIVDERLVLAVRVEANDSTTNSSSATIADKVFGISGDASNLSERYESCSYGEVLMKPFVGTTTTGISIQNGVFQITIPDNVLGVQNVGVRNSVVQALTQQLGDLPSQFDHVMLCLPHGTVNNWLAYSKATFGIGLSYR